MDWKWWVSQGTSALVMGMMAIPSLYASDIDMAKKEIRHVVVVLFQENVSFDHYFATYPHALNLPGRTTLHPVAGNSKSGWIYKEAVEPQPKFSESPKRKGAFQSLSL